MERYLNCYEVKEDCVLMHISGLKNEATLLIGIADYRLISSVHWGLMSVGKEGFKKLIPYTCVERASIPLGRWLLGVYEKDKRVEHKDRNNLNFLRNNLYCISKNDFKQQISLRGESRVCGIHEVKRKNGNITGYKVEYRPEDELKKRARYFSSFKYHGLNEAKEEAISFKLHMIQSSIKQSA
jgi:hypothetical protein